MIFLDATPSRPLRPPTKNPTAYSGALPTGKPTSQSSKPIIAPSAAKPTTSYPTSLSAKAPSTTTSYTSSKPTANLTFT
eukprot:gene18113-25459_t